MAQSAKEGQALKDIKDRFRRIKSMATSLDTGAYSEMEPGDIDPVRDIISRTKILLDEAVDFIDALHAERNPPIYFKVKRIWENIGVHENIVTEDRIRFEMQAAIEGLGSYQYIYENTIPDLLKRKDARVRFLDVSFFKGEGIYFFVDGEAKRIWKPGDLHANIAQFKVKIELQESK